MLVAIDVGNTQTTIGLFEGEHLLQTWRLSTQPLRSSDEYGFYLTSFLKAYQPRQAILASVVPPVDRPLIAALETYLKLPTLQVQPGIKTGMEIHYDPPQEVGADRIVNAVALKELYGYPGIVVDFGTATTFDVVSLEGVYVGGLIAPGVEMAVEYLHKKAAKLPRVEICKPAHLIGKNTRESIQGGIYFGYMSLVEGILRRLKKAIKPVMVVATGGYAPLFSEEVSNIQRVDLDLTLKGLYLIYEKNR